MGRLGKWRGLDVAVQSTLLKKLTKARLLLHRRVQIVNSAACRRGMVLLLLLE